MIPCASRCVDARRESVISLVLKPASPRLNVCKEFKDSPSSAKNSLRLLPANVVTSVSLQLLQKGRRSKLEKADFVPG